MVEMMNVMPTERVMVMPKAAIVSKTMPKTTIIGKTVPAIHAAKTARIPAKTVRRTAAERVCSTPERRPRRRRGTMWRRVRLCIVTGKQKQRTKRQQPERGFQYTALKVSIFNVRFT